jgi:hypothetical protein
MLKIKLILNGLDNQPKVLPIPSSLTDHRPKGGFRLLKEEQLQATDSFKEYVEGLGSKSALNKSAKKVF